MKDITAADLIQAQKKASKEAKNLTRALGLDDYLVKGDKVIKRSPSGEEIVIKKSRFSPVKVQKGTIKFSNGHKKI